MSTPKQRLNNLIALARHLGVRVKFVDPRLLDDYEAVNSEWAKANGFEMPDNMIYLPNNRDAEKNMQTLKHELYEMFRMRAGEKYWSSHRDALVFEKR